MEIKQRVGNFLFLLGIALLILFNFSEGTNEQKESTPQLEDSSTQDPSEKCIAPEFLSEGDIEDCWKKESLLVWGFLLTGLGLVTIYGKKSDGPRESERFKGLKNLLFSRPEKKKKK